MWKAGQWKVGQGHWNMCMTKEAVMGLQPGVVEGWDMGPIGIVSIVPKMATRGRRRHFSHGGATYSVSKCSKAFPGSHLAAVQFQTKIPTGSKVMAILLKCVMTCKIIETVTPGICVL